MIKNTSASSARVDFETEVDWHESHTFLKVEYVCLPSYAIAFC